MTTPRRPEDPVAAGQAPAPWEAALEEFGAVARRVAIDRGLSEAEIDEVLQDVRVRIWRATAQRESAHVSSSYVYQTAMSAALDLIRRRRRSRSVELDDMGEAHPALASRAPDPERETAHRELEHEVVRAVATLPAAAQAAVRMHLMGYARQDIGRLLRWSDGRTRNVLHRGLMKLRTILTERGYGPAAT
jgi:RNA polymerase sigma-70 factor (ECF subfamily)